VSTAATLYRPEALEAVLAAVPPAACLTIDELRAALPFTRNTLAGMLGALVLDGMVERVEAGCFKRCIPARQQVPTAGQPDLRKPRKRLHGDVQRRLWRAMRLRRKFTIAEVVQLASREGEKSINSSAVAYARALAAAGYLRLLPRAKGSRAQRWMLIRDTGSAPPTARRQDGQRWLMDPNTRERIPCSP
jgi:hypothetical protein